MSDHLRRSIAEFSGVAISQEEKGVAKYGKPLDPRDNYNWLEMAKEELVDGFKYLEAERVKRQRSVARIRELLHLLQGCEKVAVKIEEHLDRLEGSRCD
ncbi:hypothetical protein [Pontibacillus litoralis]|uniref:Uncharacterized protein n=1 Tax=Pontibacillus litoralis JSM 072002 TaxID=1385512 RepID=A0A0A5G071_9BACI|nr:hypothetical protein [Pontibacillus litoralis]KGX84465.1 hypothetical protein N784_13460 [Pontibacillus litoralis JSM 072002]